jgi:hypothetical protein
VWPATLIVYCRSLLLLLLRACWLLLFTSTHGIHPATIPTLSLEAFWVGAGIGPQPHLLSQLLSRQALLDLLLCRLEKVYELTTGCLFCWEKLSPLCGPAR